MNARPFCSHQLATVWADRGRYPVTCEARRTHPIAAVRVRLVARHFAANEARLNHAVGRLFASAYPTHNNLGLV